MAAAKMMKVAFLLPVLAASIRINEDALKLTELELLGRSEEQQVAAQAADEEPPAEPQKEDECALAVPASSGAPAGLRRKSAWRRSNTCKCPEGSMLDCPEEDCEKLGRYFKAATVQDKGCSCRTDCATNCEDIVQGAMWRKSSWRRSVKCKCPKDHVVGGSSQKCANHDSRYFTNAQLRDEGCSCVPDGEVSEGEAPKPPAAGPTPAQAPPTDNAPAPTPDREGTPVNRDPAQEEKKGGLGGTTRMAGGLAASVVLAAVAAMA